jgi:hypothetical protein
MFLRVIRKAHELLLVTFNAQAAVLGGEDTREQNYALYRIVRI